jgi:hypothetical protein
MQWNAERTSVSNHWGGSPLLIEPVEGQIQFHHSAGLECVPLDGAGRPQAGKETRLTLRDGGCAIPLAAADATVWYLLRQR